MDTHRADARVDLAEEEALVQLDTRRRARVTENIAGPVASRAHVALDRPSATDEFADEHFLRQGAVKPEDGWRRALYRLSGGRVNPGPSAAQRARAELVARVRAPLADCRRIAVVSRKGGVGKTSVTLGLGHTFATLRHDRVVALDGNPDAGTLGYRLAGESGRTLTELLADATVIGSYSDVRQYTGQSDSRLEIVASDDDPRITQAVGAAEYRTAVEVLERHYNVLLTDTGTDITSSVMQGVLDTADQIVVVVSPSLDGARAAAKTLDWLVENGHDGLVRSAVAVLNGVRDRSKLDLERVSAHFASRCATVVRIPWDAQLEAGGQASLDDLHGSTRTAYLQLAAAIADGFGPVL